MDAKLPLPQPSDQLLHDQADRFLDSLPSRVRLHAVTLNYEIYGDSS